MLKHSLLENWKKVISLGLHTEIDQKARIQLLTSNAFAVIVIGLVLIFTLIFVSVGSTSALQGFIIVPLMILAIVLNSQQQYNTAKFVLVFVLLLAVLVLSLSDRRTGTEYALIAVACSSALFYEKFLSIISAFLTAVLCYGFYLWYDTTYPFVPDPTVPYFIINNFILLLSVSVVLVHFLIFRGLLNQYAHKLKCANEEIQTSNEELLTINNHLDEIVKEKSKELKSYIDAISVNIFSAVIDTKGVILKVNEPLLAASKFTESELVGKSVRIFKSEHHPKKFFKALYEQISKGKIWRGELNSNDKFGNQFWVDMVIMPISDDDGKPKQFLILSLPISERKRAEAEREEAMKKLQKSEARYRAVVENQPDFISLSNTNGDLVFVNETYAKFMGSLSPGSMHVNNNTSDVFSNTNPFLVSLQLMENASGEKRWVHWRNQGLFDDNGKLFEQLCVGRDVTELKEAESQKVNHLQALERIAFETSHAIRGPLARILGLIYLVDKNAIKRSELISVVDKLKTCAGELDQSTRNLDNFVNERQNRLRVLVNPAQSNNNMLDENSLRMSNRAK